MDNSRLSPMHDFSQTLAERSAARLQTIAGQVRVGLQTQMLPFSAESLQTCLNVDDYAYLEVKQYSRVYPLVCTYVAHHGTVHSLRYAGEIDEESADRAGLLPEDSYVSTIGLGLFPFKWHGHDLYALHQTVGQPVGTPGGADFYTNLVLFAPADSPGVLGQFCRELIASSELTRKGTVNVFEWNAANMFWQMTATIPARPIESVVLPCATKDKLLADLQEFFGPETKHWYQEHGIPHKRGYLFHGAPGAGKTSLIQAIAGKFEYNICYVHLANPRLTDDSLRTAVNQAPKRSVLVLEDVDALFGKHREKLIKDSPLTFSGLLNSIDGIGKADGQIFILTTNHRERLSPALIRNGRADVHIHFTCATDEQISGMFRRFYPLSSEKTARDFVQALRSVLCGCEVTPAALQNFFILHRTSPALRAIECVQDIVDELESREVEQKLAEQEPKGHLEHT